MSLEDQLMDNQWEHVPGLLELLEKGVDPVSVSETDSLIISRRRDGNVLSYLNHVWKWLRGFRRDQVVYARKPIWVPIAELYPPPGGRVIFTHEKKEESESTAELTIAGIVGYGSGCRRSFSTSITQEVVEPGLAFCTQAYLTITRYVHKEDPTRTFDRIDVEGSQGHPVDAFRDLPESFWPTKANANAMTYSQIAASGYTILRELYCMKVKRETEVTANIEDSHEWRFKFSLDAPLLRQPLNLGVSSKHSSSFGISFYLPPGSNYALCTRTGESPLAPVCVRLDVEGDKSV